MRTVVFCVAFCLLQLPASVEPLPGSCIAANYTTCCEGSPTNCPGEPATCYCDTSCYEFDDCCNDMNQICPPKLPPPPKPFLLPPTHTTLHSTTIQWIRTPTNSSTNQTYMYTVNYYTNGTNPTTINVTDFLGTGEVFSILLRGLDSATTYIYSVSIFDMVGSSTTSEESIFTTMEYPVVRHVQTRVLNSTAVSVSWSALHLPPGVTVSHYTVHYRSSGSTEETQIFSGGETCGEIGGLTPHTRYSFHVRGTIVDVDGSVSEGNSPGNGSTIFIPGERQSAFTLVPSPCPAFSQYRKVATVKSWTGIWEQGYLTCTVSVSCCFIPSDSALFQLRGGPLQNCVDWSADDERELFVFFRSVTVGAITSQCGCAYQDSLLTKDIILCETGSPTWATFRATLMSTEMCTAGRLLQCLQDWVSHRSDMQGTPDASATFDIDRNCLVRVRLSSAPLCSPRAVSGQTSANRTETCIGVPVFVATLVAVLLLVAAVTMAVIVVALLVTSKRHKKKVPSEHYTGESPGRQGAVPNVYHERTPPSDNNLSTNATTD